MHTHSTNRSPGNILAALPSAGGVCGSLDPPARSKKTSKTGWRYIQLTNTLDELRVLLPPRPAAIYANLLKVEAHVLTKNDAESLQELQYIRHLKDVMVRRCQKLAQDTIHDASPTQGSRQAMVQAPLDFKVKRLEQWWETMEPQVKPKRHSSYSKLQAHAERASRVQVSPSTAAVSPSKSKHGTVIAQANASYANSVGQAQYNADPQASPAMRKKRLAPLTVSAGHTVSAQSSPLIPHSPSTLAIRASAQSGGIQSPHDYSGRPQMRQAAAQRPVYTNTQMVSPLETPYNPSFDPNQSLSHQYPVDSRTGLPVEVRSPVVAMSPHVNDPRLKKQRAYSPVDAIPESMVSPGDPSHLKSRFHATYMSSPSDSNSSPSSNGNKASPYAQQNPTGSREHVEGYLQGQPPHTRMHGSYSTPLPSKAAPISEKEHRRRATVDCDDTDRSVPRPKGYMYRRSAIYGKAQDPSAEMHYNEHAYDVQGVRHADGDSHSPSAIRRVARVLNQSLVPGGSPRSSTGSQGSPRLHGSPGASHGMESSPHSQNSPGRNSYSTRGYGATLSVEQAYPHSSGGVKNGSPNLLPPDPGLSRSRRGSNESNGSASQIAMSVQGDNGNIYPARQLRRTISRRGLRDPSSNAVDPAAGISQPVVPPAEYYTKSPRRSTISPPDAQQSIDADNYYRGRTRRGENPPRRRRAYDASSRRESAVIPDMEVFTPMGSNRNSRYTSGDSSVSEPVIPDVALIMEAELSRNKGDRVRRRLVPLQSSSEEGGSRHASDFESFDFSSSDDDEDDDAQEVGYYRRPYRTRDGYGSGYASEAGGVNSRAPSRAPSRSPSRGILKRPSSVLSQRSNKSVRLEIPRDRRALEEVRDADDKVDRAQRHLDDLQRRKGSQGKSIDPDVQKAVEALDQAERSLKEKEDEYRTILAAMKLKQSERDETQPRYV